MRTMKAYKSIDAYIADGPKDMRATLQKLRLIIQKAEPTLEEAIRYGLPTFRLNTSNIIHFGVFKTHIGLYPGPDAIKQYKKELAQYRTTKGTVQLPLTKTLPAPLITKLVRFAVQEYEKKHPTGPFALLSKPAQRALLSARIKTVKDLSKRTQKEVMSLHGMGPKSLPRLRALLKKEKCSFAT